MSVTIKKTSAGYEVWTFCGPREIFATLAQAKRYARELEKVPKWNYKL
jgi:hypothetical protein